MISYRVMKTTSTTTPQYVVVWEGPLKEYDPTHFSSSSTVTYQLQSSQGEGEWWDVVEGALVAANGPTNYDSIWKEDMEYNEQATDTLSDLLQ